MLQTFKVTGRFQISCTEFLKINFLLRFYFPAHFNAFIASFKCIFVLKYKTNSVDTVRFSSRLVKLFAALAIPFLVSGKDLSEMTENQFVLLAKSHC